MNSIAERRARVLAVLKSVLPTISRKVVLNGHEFKIIDPSALADEFGFDRLQILNDLADLTGLGEIVYGHKELPTGKPGRYAMNCVVRLL
ncbi:MAG: hypothetical protein C0467_19965 [Planctomycetaceae bacterium]|nr:hypothetical protein [Planctomycetaceae bacterium]